MCPPQTYSPWDRRHLPAVQTLRGPERSGLRMKPPCGPSKTVTRNARGIPTEPPGGCNKQPCYASCGSAATAPQAARRYSNNASKIRYLNGYYVILTC